MQQQDAVDGRSGIAYDNRIGEWTERCRDTALVARLDGEERSDRADNSHGVARLQERTWAIAARQRDPESLEAGRERCPLALTLTLLVAERLDVRVGLSEARLGLLVLRIEAEFARIEAGHLRLEGRELSLRRGRAGVRIIALGCRALDLRGTRLAARSGCCHASSEASQVLAAVGLRPNPLGNPAFLVGHLALRLGPLRRRLGQGGPVCLDLPAEGELLLAQDGGFGLERGGIAPTLDLILDVGTDEAQSLRRQ